MKKDISAESIIVAAGLVLLAALILYLSFERPAYFFAVHEGATLTTRAESEVSRYAVNVNYATVEELLGVKHMNERMANGIVAYRNEHGFYMALEELLLADGVGEASLEKIRPYIKVGLEE